MRPVRRRFCPACPTRLSRILFTLLIGTAVLSSVPATCAWATEARYNRVSLQAQAQRDVLHDLMRVTLYSEMQDNNPAKLAANTTRVLNHATTQARQVAGVTLQSGSRTSHPVYDKDRKRIIAWRERAELHLESGDFAALATLTAALQSDELKVARREFMISRARRKAEEDSLMKEAIAAFRDRAKLVTQALDGKDYRLVSLDMDGSGLRVTRRSEPWALMAAPAPALAAPSQQIEAGSSVVSVTASGTIEIGM